MKEPDIIKLYGLKRALIVDEIPDMRASIRLMLRNFGCQHIDLCCNGREAIERCRESHYDIVICDYTLGGGKNGQQVLEELRYIEALKSGAIYILLTAETTRSAVFGAIESKPDDFLTKPLSQAELQRRLDRVLREKNYFKTVYQALDEKDYVLAASFAGELANAKGVYKSIGAKLRGEALLKAGQFNEAAGHYKKIIKNTPTEWALIGYSRALSGASRWDVAQKILGGLQAKGSESLDLYDALVDAEIELGNMDSAQHLLEGATSSSPNGILRQVLLGNVARENESFDVSEKAYRKVMKLAVNSCYDSCEHSFGLIRCLLDKEKGQQETDQQVLDECQNILTQIKQKFSSRERINLNADILSVSLAVRKGYFDHAEEACKGIYRRYAEMENKDAQLGLDMASAFAALNQRDKSQAVLEDLVVRYGDQPSLLRRIDALSDTPITHEAKNNAGAINNHGKVLFENGNHTETVEHFRRAIKRYPNNVVIKLNLVLALIKYAEVEETEKIKKEALKSADKILMSLETLSADNPAYKRYLSLSDKAKKLSMAA